MVTISRAQDSLTFPASFQLIVGVSPGAETGAYDAQHDVADLAGSESIGPSHLAEALQYRPRLMIG